jgi:hypothetical protein
VSKLLAFSRKLDATLADLEPIDPEVGRFIPKRLLPPSMAPKSRNSRSLAIPAGVACPSLKQQYLAGHRWDARPLPDTE